MEQQEFYKQDSLISLWNTGVFRIIPWRNVCKRNHSTGRIYADTTKYEVSVTEGQDVSDKRPYGKRAGKETGIPVDQNQ